MSRAASPHACHVYSSDTELIAVATDFLNAGLQQGERCWYVARGDELPRLRAALGAAGVMVKTAERQRALSLLAPTTVYQAFDQFSPEQMMDVFSKGISDALRDGFTGFRAAGEMSWANHPALADRLLEYEHLITTLLINSRATGLCLYDRACPHLPHVVPAHPFVVVDRGRLAVNPRFDPTGGRSQSA